PAKLAGWSVAFGFVYAAWSILWIVFNALWLYNLALETGSFEQLRVWMRRHASGDACVQAVLVARVAGRKRGVRGAGGGDGVFAGGTGIFTEEGGDCLAACEHRAGGVWRLGRSDCRANRRDGAGNRQAFGDGGPATAAAFAHFAGVP